MLEQFASPGLVVALAGAPTILLVTRLFGLKPLSAIVRISFWGLAALVLALAAARDGGLVPALSALGLASPSGASGIWGLGGAGAILVAMALTSAALRAFGLPFGDKAGFDQILGLSFGYRLFIVITAAVQEEVLYRGGALTFGVDAFGSPYVAAMVAVAAFTLAHFRWRAAHLINVAISGTLLTALYLRTGDLFACMIAHFLVDAGGFLIAPALMRRRHKAV